ncbi:hypothetical protein [Wenzhouxiangella marina]|uniref:Uncharacterized protein n=1 Tax=Wenzhouxiangella marina TaxID=1579979 RepID=A0A0K0XYR5_9GAMM|nr:hypothetical protein [Wenzhouxiangella marina]AKS42766.1 hypothetical protein WM2015_2404 [Wenzhouxiangella marina]MBB6087556.1 hypothetical protein [Wenzhouxiangella marina]
MNEISIIRLAESIAEGELYELNQAEVSAVLGWVTRSKSNEHRQALEQALGSVDTQPELALNALRILEHSLFFNDVFQQGKAGVSSEFEHDARRRRYRLLLSAFHPDRVPGEDGWLTQRSQAIIQAYQVFKRNPDAETEEARPEAGAHHAHSQGGRTPPHRGPIKHREGSLAMFLRQRFGGDRWLAHKLIGGLVLLLGLAVISVLLSEPATLPETAFDPRPSPRSVESRPDAQPATTAVNNETPERSAGAEGGDGWIRSEPQTGIEEEEPASIEPADATTRVASTTMRSSAVDDSAGPQSSSLASVTTSAQERGAGPPAAIDSERVEPSPVPRQNGLANEAPIPSRSERLQSNTGQGSAPPSASNEGSEPGPDPARRQASNARGDSNASATRPARAPVIEPSSSRGGGPPPGQLSLGPVMRHRVGELLQSYQRAFETGDLEGVMGLFGDQPRLDRQSGRAPLEHYFTTLFEASDGRRLSLQVHSAERDGNDWIVRASQRIELLNGAGTASRVQNLDVLFQFAPSPFALKITAIQAQNPAN